MNAGTAAGTIISDIGCGYHDDARYQPAEQRRGGEHRGGVRHTGGFERDQFGESESGDRRKQHYLHAERDQQRSGDGQRSGVHGNPSSEYFGCVINWTRRMDVRSCDSNLHRHNDDGRPPPRLTFTFVVKVNTTVAQGSTITQTDSVSSTTVDPNGDNNSATVNTQVGSSADLSITNTASPIPVLANTHITYTQVVTNNGPSAATSVTLTDVLPANTTFRIAHRTGGVDLLSWRR